MHTFTRPWVRAPGPCKDKQADCGPCMPVILGLGQVRIGGSGAEGPPSLHDKFETMFKTVLKEQQW